MLDVSDVPSVRANDRDLILALDMASIMYADSNWREFIMNELNLSREEYRQFYVRIEAHLRLYQADAC